MKTLSVQLPSVAARHYPIWIGHDTFTQLPKELSLDTFSKRVVITDEQVAKHWRSRIEVIITPDLFITLPEGEREKNSESASIVWERMLQHGIDRKALVFNIGGGVIGDLGGFAASTYMRGISFVQVPTTLLSQVDASVGGKLGIDHGGVKNSVGTFAQPLAVAVDLSFLTTLPSREFNSGVAEIIKHGLIADSDYFHELERASLSPESADLDAIIERSCQLKALVVERDEREGGLRKILNFGHTIGHAIESLLLSSKKPLLHGEAIAIGIVAEGFLSMKKGYLDRDALSRIERCLSLHHLPTRIPHAVVPIDHGKFFELIAKDKKNVAGEVRWTLLTQIGKACFDEVVDHSLVGEALHYISHD